MRPSILQLLAYEVLRQLRNQFEGERFTYAEELPLVADQVTFAFNGDEAPTDAGQVFAAELRKLNPTFTRVHRLTAPPHSDEAGLYIAWARDPESGLEIRGKRTFNPLLPPCGIFMNRFDIAVS